MPTSEERVAGDGDREVWAIDRHIADDTLGVELRLALENKEKKQAGQSTPASADLISNLFKDVMDLILVRLPIKDAVRTSILSKKWRYKWVSIPDLVFDKDCLMEGASEKEYAHVVDQVLLNHVGPICKFSCTNYVPSCSHIDRWIAFLSRNGIKKITIVMNLLEDRYDVPSSIFNCQELDHLELHLCRLKVPPTFKGFENLLVLDLNYAYISDGHASWKRDVSMSEDEIAFLIAKCPLLERLKLSIPAFHQCLKIHAPSLRCFEFNGQFRDLSLGSSPLLTNVSMYSILPPSFWDILEESNTCNLDRFAEYSHRVERLALKDCSLQVICSLPSLPYYLQASSSSPPQTSPPSPLPSLHGDPPSSFDEDDPMLVTLHSFNHFTLFCFCKYFLVSDVPEKLSATYDHLKYLEVHIELNSKEILATLCILRSSPNLKELKIKYLLYDDERFNLTEEEASFWGAKIQFDCLLNHLHAVEIIGLALSMDLEFVRYILSSAPVLETMKVYTYEYLEEQEVSRIKNELMRFRRASSRAEIIYLGHYEDNKESCTQSITNNEEESRWIISFPLF
ncbi:F-box/RNI-like superfamily protein isoform 1 [Cinnamomum micranthum f. kanehirae]|uniref:F-box/RNI-like superfamily protein isoform 1 n=1 Tax=Cinnamomum micranthum f. kanehirae TaxID=337451 RepID=A0A3S4NSY8_9MAGN|nr:F-box/RNI-like superfamily protein isoform 1 [Cinnamomum micranthum f. kanehirae]